MERVSINNIVVRFFSSEKEAKIVADRMNSQVFQHAEINQYVVAKSIDVEFPEIFDESGIIFTQRTLENSPISKVWTKEFTDSLTLVV